MTEYGKARKKSLSNTKEWTHLNIQSGQFACIETNETITIPKNAMAFITVNTHKKMAGLINVSGFHVDPGYSGKLIFTVFNAGPSNINIEKNELAFRLWLADLNEPSEKTYENKQGLNIKNITKQLHGDLYNPLIMEERLRNLEISRKNWFLGLLSTFTLGILLTMITDFFEFIPGYRDFANTDTRLDKLEQTINSHDKNKKQN